MEDLKDDSLLVLRLIKILAVLFMIVFSKLGAYILLLISIAGSCLLWGKISDVSFVDNFTITILLGSVVFEIMYPVVFSSSQSYYNEAKGEFVNAQTELKRRKIEANSIDG